ncbi:6-phosphogluconate dehydrogenase C-terminal domain-like protein [Patellaria atrata CBS 101060]|uniref:6-phosphogluconate dehydrogenase C-terminal domain-like protein n=1 Tax=Patellaria atrata CBS 101060 TaxID=1346257 RepID=A0A9P4VQ28_9PEZI|nr:6-phosphogluconate dehydrogenase C-terminal domain-like protein [Patellaria atrata CBS 101060]
MAVSKATISILSVGEMGLGIAKLLRAHDYNVLTNVTGRSRYTADRAASASITLVPTDAELVTRSDYILSIVPPRDAIATAERIVAAYSNLRTPRTSNEPLYYLDLNATSPRTINSIADRFSDLPIRLIDGGIIGAPPSLRPDSASSSNTEAWTRPSVPLSGPYPLSSAPMNGSELAVVLNTYHLCPSIGTASGLKSCFASLTKGLTALAIQSFSTAHSLQVLPALQSELHAYTPKLLESVERSLVGMPPKAYRWVDEMSEIGRTFEGAGWEEERVFENMAKVYETVTKDTVLGAEKTGERKMGRTVEDVTDAVVKGLRKRRRGESDGKDARVDGGEGDEKK